MTDLRDKAARALCAKECAAFGDPPCWKIVDDWGPDNCCEEGGPNCFNRADAALAVVEKEAAPGVKVKPLEWWRSDTGDLCCDTLVGRYQIQKGGARYCMMPAMQRHVPSGQAPSYHRTEEAAKAAAQADYEARILSALEPSAPTVQEAAREMEKATRAFSAGVFSDNGDVTVSTGHLTTQHWLRLSAAQSKLTNALRALADGEG